MHQVASCMEINEHNWESKYQVKEKSKEKRKTFVREPPVCLSC